MIEMRVINSNDLEKWGGEWKDMVGIFFANYIDDGGQFDADFLGTFRFSERPSGIYIDVPEYYKELLDGGHLVGLLFKPNKQLDALDIEKIHLLFLKSNREANMVNPFPVVQFAILNDAEPN